MLLSLAVLASFAPQGPSTAPVVINEFSYDDNGTDDLEFVELWNRTAAPVDISGWRLQGEEGDATGAANGSFTFPGTPGSATTVILPGQYLMVSQSLVPNHDPLYVMPTTMMENGGGTTTPGADGLTLRDGAGNVVDGVTWEYAAWTAPVPAWLEGDGLQGASLLTVSPLTLNGTSYQRWLDGFDSDNNGADYVVMQWTPGAANGSLNTVGVPIVENFDALAGTTITTLFASSFVSPRTADPATLQTSGAGIWSLPPSPQGGNVGALHDVTGGGNAHISLSPVATDYLVECYVYIAGGNVVLPANEKDSWAIGVGTTDSYGHPVDVAGTYYPGLLCNIGNGPGAAGICWIAYNTTTQTELYLVDMNNGGPGFTVIGGPIVATPGVNDGWQRLRLRASGSNVVGNFGGTFGVDDGTRFTGTVTPRQFGQVYLQYRECVLVNANMRPLVVDGLEIYGTVDSSVTFTGTGSPTFAGVPQINATGLPQTGNSAFTIDGSSMVPNGVSLLALDIGSLLPGIPVPGAQPSLLVYAGPTFTATVFNTAGGTASFNLPIPATNSLLGTLLAAQYFDLDPTSVFPLPFGSSRGAQITIGNG